MPKYLLTASVSPIQQAQIDEVERLGFRVTLEPMVQAEDGLITLEEAHRRMRIRKSWSGQIDPFRQ